MIRPKGALSTLMIFSLFALAACAGDSPVAPESALTSGEHSLIKQLLKLIDFLAAS